jgi:hypothetical protein
MKLSKAFLNWAIALVVINICLQFFSNLSRLDPTFLELSLESTKNFVIILPVFVFISSTFFIYYLRKKKYHFAMLMLALDFIFGPIVLYYSYQLEFYGTEILLTTILYLVYCFLVIVSGIVIVISKTKERKYLKVYGITLIVLTFTTLLGILLIATSHIETGSRIIQYCGFLACFSPILLVLNYHSEKFPDETLNINDEIVDAD